MVKRMVSETIKETPDGDKLMRVTCFEGESRPTNLSYIVFVKRV